ncbi:unnamed protein product [Bursaphelenchus okinawaensis]|uniref:DNA-directed RNA polymerase RBP11-like dimerisation domain-containing protein n=1 Tax=Bursaphelenchus okinawaensis TaxID=465554 RepID=A0A811KBE1_9BILA|nr:unnamed protein product [Bursaphelenchus okinawaensis]CAG9099112.1 unnamed protein product [Bursaphelenchus okinawaensis]
MSEAVEYPSVQLPKGLEIVDADEYLKDKTMITVVMKGEDHTISNLLKHVIGPMDGVEFVGAGETHPLEDRIVVRVQTKPGVDAAEVLAQGFQLTEQLFAGIEEKIDKACEEFDSK